MKEKIKIFFKKLSGFLLLFLAGLLFSSFISGFLFLLIIFLNEKIVVLFYSIGSIIGTPIMMFLIHRAIETKQGFLYKWFGEER